MFFFASLVIRAIFLYAERAEICHFSLASVNYFPRTFINVLSCQRKSNHYYTRNLEFRKRCAVRYASPLSCDLTHAKCGHDIRQWRAIRENINEPRHFRGGGGERGRNRSNPRSNATGTKLGVAG